MAEQRVRDLGLFERFRFLGFRANAPRLIPAFDIVAVPSHVEPLGNATLEAMAAARPVVGSRVGGIPEMVVDRETGLLVAARDPVGLADAIGTLIHDAKLRERLGLAGRARAERAFSLEAHGQRLQRLYDQVLGRARPA
jgi:glycosyltransferase involved in cell wall biosynthesis